MLDVVEDRTNNFVVTIALLEGPLIIIIPVDLERVAVDPDVLGLG